MFDDTEDAALDIDDVDAVDTAAEADLDEL
jgi:hypothetical protein